MPDGGPSVPAPERGTGGDASEASAAVTAASGGALASNAASYRSDLREALLAMFPSGVCSPKVIDPYRPAGTLEPLSLMRGSLVNSVRIT